MQWCEKIRQVFRKPHHGPPRASIIGQTELLGYHEGMGRVAKTPRRGRALNPRDIPNRESREAMAAFERGEGEVCKDANDLLKKLKS